MKYKIPRNVGLISIVLALALLLAIYTVLGTVDLVYVVDGVQTSAEDVNVLSKIDFPDQAFTCNVGDTVVAVDDLMDLRVQIGKTVFCNFINLKWQEEDSVITITINNAQK